MTQTQLTLHHIVNSLEMTASPVIVWNQLITAADWTTWYPGFSNIQIQGGSHELYQGANFTWNAGGAKLASTVREFVPNERLAWDAKALGLQAYHAWSIVPTPNGCRVLSDETQRGLLARLLKLFTPNTVSRWNQGFLEALALRSTPVRA